MIGKSDSSNVLLIEVLNTAVSIYGVISGFIQQFCCNSAVVTKPFQVVNHFKNKTKNADHQTIKM